MTAIEITAAVLAGVIALATGTLLLLRFDLWLKRRRAERERADAAIDRFLRREFRVLEDTQEFDIPSLFNDRPND